MFHSRHKLLLSFAAPLAAMCCCASAFAQEDAFDAPKAKAKPAAKAATVRDKGGRSIDLAPPDDPVVTALLASNPTTPSEIFHTGQLLLDASRPELAKRYFRKLLDAKPDEAHWSALVDEFHSTAFSDLAEHIDLRPENEELIQAALGAVNRRLRNPARVAEEIKQLQDPSPEVRGQAIRKLRGAHEAAVEALIEVLDDPQRADEHAAVRAALAAMRSEAIDPLADIIERADPEFMVEAIRALAEMHASEAIVYLYLPALAEDSDLRVREPARAAIRQLLGSMPTAAQAAQQLYDLARTYFAGKQTLHTDINGRVTLWSWDAAAKKCVARSCPPDDAARAFAARLARAAQSLAPNNRSAQALALAAELEQMVYERGLDKGLDFKDAEVKRLSAADPRLMEDVLVLCLAEHHAAGGRAAAEILGHSEKADVLHGGAGPSPLVRAVRSSDARLRMAALEAIARLQPKTPFPGSSFALDALAFQAASAGGRRALAVSPTAETLEEWIGVLKFRNFTVGTATSGSEAVRMATRSPDYELVVIDMATQSPAAEEIVQQLHQDYRTAGLRIALVAPSATLERARRIAESDPLTIAFSQPVDAAAARWQLAQLNALVPREFVGFSERQQLAVKALDCLAKLGGITTKIFDIKKAEDAILAGLLVPRLSSHAVAALVNLGTHDSQQALVDVASRVVNPIALRQAGAAAFNANVQRFGLLLKQESVRQQYRRYQQSASQDPAAQQVLAAILNTIETRATPSVLQAARQAAQPPKAAQPKRLVAPDGQ